MTTTDQMKEKIQQAERAVENMTDVNLKTKAFEVILNNLLSDKSAAKSTSGPEVTSSEKDADFSISKLQKISELNEDQLAQLVEFDENDFTIIASVPGKLETAKQQNATLLILAVMNYVYGSKEMNTTILRKKLTDMGIGSLTNLSTNLKSFENYIVKKGDVKDVTYRITTPGLKKAIELMKNLVGVKND